MITYALRRLIYSIPVVIIASFLLFWAVRRAFDPLSELRQSQDPEALARETERLGLDQPIPKQYLDWFTGFVTGDWGISSRTGREVTDMILDAAGPTIQLIVCGVVLGALFALIVGAYSAVKQYSIPDYALTTASYIGIALPAFWFGLLLIQVLGVLPVQMWDLSEPPLFFVGLHSVGEGGFGLDYLRHLALPVVTMTITLVAGWSRYGRASMLEALSSDYVRTARAKGVPRVQVIIRHALRNSLAPFITVVFLDAGLLFGGLVVTEQIFSVPGMGKLLLDSLLAGDAQLVLSWMMLVALTIVVFNLIADLSYARLDPRVKLS
ncbi:peptide/nickel transport system permease protein [Brevibacterium siliguriense]|uniref:Peptide/nickel transport system permease protein n=1 Tax=Brevibacterium siliguriense TaxID=1136497 RepID=A0A1H1Y3P4_9MICO|nr:ABC transporter permease [Brevibacterium siliguriense]SDT16047.1 peptide/nickel transport system permease protein [Brevibacterium siliguriense]